MKKLLIPILLGSLFLVGCTSQKPQNELDDKIDNNIQENINNNIFSGSEEEKSLVEENMQNLTQPFKREELGLLLMLPQERKASKTISGGLKIFTDKKDDKWYQEYVLIYINKMDIQKALEWEEENFKMGGDYVDKDNYLELQKSENKLLLFNLASEAISLYGLRLGSNTYKISIEDISSDQPAPEWRDDAWTAEEKGIKQSDDIYNTTQKILWSIKKIN